MFFLALVSVVSLVSVAIDAGSYFIKSTIVKGSEMPAIGLNAHSKRLTPSFIAFRAKRQFNATRQEVITADEVGLLEPVIGQNALDIMETRPVMGSGHFATLVGYDEWSAFKKAKAVCVPTTAARVNFQDLFPVFLNAYVKEVAGELDVSHMTFVFPASYTSLQRRYFYRAAEICGFLNYTEMDDVDAVAMTYAIDKIHKLENMKKRVLFVDVGGLSVKAYVLEMYLRDTTPVSRRLSYEIDTNNGGAYLTGELAAFIKEQLGVSELTNAETRRVFSAAEKAKKELTLLRGTKIVIEDISGRDRKSVV